MSFDEVSFPLKADYGSVGGVQFQTEVVVIDSGYERRNQKWSQARRRYDAKAYVRTAYDAALLLSFFQARAGRARGFRLRDWCDYSSAQDGKMEPAWHDQEIGIGDGVEASFQLVKTYGNDLAAYQREIRKPVDGAVLIGVDGVEYESGWNVDCTTGIVTFVQAPSVGAVIKAGYLFEVPVRFDQDNLNLTAIDRQLVDAEIPLVEVRV